MTADLNFDKYTGYSGGNLLEREHQFALPTAIIESNLFDFVDLERYLPSTEANFDEEEGNIFLSSIDEYKLADAHSTAHDGSGISKIKSGEVTWLRKTEYISSEIGKRGANKGEKKEEPLQGRSPSKETISGSVNQLLQILEKSLEDRSFNLSELKHPRDPTLHAVKSFSMIPEDLSDELSFTQCSFDTAPGTGGTAPDGSALHPDADSHALIKAMKSQDKKSEPFVWYYMPTKDSQSSLSSDQQYAFVREYDIQRAERSARFYSLRLSKQDERAYYRLIDSHFILKKRPANSSGSGSINREHQKITLKRQ